MIKNNQIVLCDVDGVLADFVSAILKTSGTKLRPEDINEWDMFSMMEPWARKNALKTLQNKDFWRKIPVLPNAQAEIERIKRAGNDVLYVTSPWANETEGWTCDGWGWARTHWLREHFGASHKDIILAYKKGYVQGDVLIDDRYKNIVEWQKMNPEGQGILMERPYNINMDWKHRVRQTENGWEFYERPEED